MSGKVAAVAWCLAASVLAQDSAPATRPESRRATETVVDCGLRVRIVPIDVPGELAVILGFRNAGILSEPAGQPHLAHVSEHVRFHQAPEGADLAKAVGKWLALGRANAETLPDVMYFDLYPTRAELPAALRLQVGRLFGATGDQAVLEREKAVALSEVTGLEGRRTAGMDALGKFAWSAFTQVGIHGAKDVPFKAHTAEITLEDVRKFGGIGRFRPDRAMLTIAGNFDPGEVDAELRTVLEATKALIEQEPFAPFAPFVPKPGVRAGTWDVASNQFFMAWIGPPPSDRAHPALAAFARVLATRLALAPEIRAAALQPTVVHADVGGLFAVQSPLRKKEGGEALAAEIRKAIDSCATGQGLMLLDRAKYTARVNSGFPPGPLQYPPGLPRQIMLHANYELARMRVTLAAGQTAEEYCARVDEITAGDVKAAVNAWLAPEKAAIVTIAGKE